MKYKPKPLKSGWHYKRGDVYLVDLNPSRGCEQGGVRPAVVVQNDSGNHFSPVLIVVPLTTKIKKETLPTHCVIRNRCLSAPSMAICESPRPIDKGRVQGYIGLEAGVSVLLPGVKFDNSTGHDRNILASAEFFVRPALGMVVNFRKVSLDIGVKCGFSPYVMLYTDNGTFWHPIPAFGVGLWF